MLRHNYYINITSENIFDNNYCLFLMTERHWYMSRRKSYVGLIIYQKYVGLQHYKIVEDRSSCRVF